MKTVCIYHSIDLDGWMSAAIVKHWFINQNKNHIVINIDNQSSSTQGSIIDINRLDFIGYNYGQPILDLSGYDKVIMCDISFSKEEMFKIKDKLIWIDHHISAIKDIYGEHKWLPTDNDIKGIIDVKFAACELTWQYFFPNKPIPEIVRLLGRYDCFGHKGTNEEQKVLEFQYGARQYISNYEKAYYYLTTTFDIENKPLLPQIFDSGKSIYKYLCTEAKQVYKNGFDITFDIGCLNNNSVVHQSIGEKEGCNQNCIECEYNGEYKFLCINKERFNPINFGIDYHKDGYDGAASFHRRDDGKWAFSLYNDNGKVDCSQIAKQYGGGGHKGAAGFTIDDINSIIK